MPNKYLRKSPIATKIPSTKLSINLRNNSISMILHIPMISPITKYHQLIDYSPSTVNSDLFFQPLKNRIICSGVKYKFWKINYPIPLEFVSNWSMKILSRRRSLRKKILISSRLLNLLPVMNQKLGTSWRKKL